jgi:hypothetical protein
MAMAAAIRYLVKMGIFPPLNYLFQRAVNVDSCATAAYIPLGQANALSQYLLVQTAQGKTTLHLLQHF